MINRFSCHTITYINCSNSRCNGERGLWLDRINSWVDPPNSIWLITKACGFGRKTKNLVIPSFLLFLKCINGFSITSIQSTEFYVSFCYQQIFAVSKKLKVKSVALTSKVYGIAIYRLYPNCLSSNLSRTLLNDQSRHLRYAFKTFPNESLEKTYGMIHYLN